MGLLYPFPVSESEADFVRIELNQTKVQKITLKTYGLPYLFWGYAAACLTALFFLWLAVREPLAKLKTLGDSLDQTLIVSLEILIAVTPIMILSFLFFEKKITCEKASLKLTYKVFGLPLYVRTMAINPDSYRVLHHLDSPNVARIKGGEEAVGFQNKGYFKLWVDSVDGKSFEIDRHSRKADLIALSALLKLPS
jgi:hypothetical protein